MSMATMVMIAGRRRDERGRYMDGDEGAEMRRGNNQYTRERRGEMDDGSRMDGEMAYNRRNEMAYSRGGGNRGEMDGRENRDRPDMRRGMAGEGWVVWDNAEGREPAWEPPERYGSPRGRGEDNITDMRQYGRRYSPGMHMDKGEEPKRKIGFERGESEGGGEHLTRDMAEEWVASMKGADGSKGGRWKLSEIKQYAQNFGVSGEQKVIEFYAIINAMAADYGKVAKKFGVDKVDFYAELAKAWLEDKDAVPGKAMAYYEYIVKKDEE